MFGILAILVMAIPYNGPESGLFCYNPAMLLQTLISRFLDFADGLKYRSQFLIILGILVIDLLVPDVIPFFDEIILGLVAVFLANWKKDRQIQHDEKDIIEGEVVNEDKENLNQ